MSTRQDPLVEKTSPDRVHYATGMLLGAEDFTHEQLYHRGRLARALAYLQGSGTVAGLKVALREPEEGAEAAEEVEETLEVEPGLAIDRLGRLIEIPHDACIRLNRWYEDQDPDELRQGFKTGLVHPLSGDSLPDGVVVDLFVRFVACERGKTPAFVAGPFDALDAVQPSRLRDGYELELVIRTESPPPLPRYPWPHLADLGEAEARDRLHEAILGAWREITEFDDAGRLQPRPEHAAGQDPTSVLLARLILPAADGNPPTRSTEDGQLVAITILNELRPFVYTAGALGGWLGIPKARDEE